MSAQDLTQPAEAGAGLAGPDLGSFRAGEDQGGHRRWQKGQEEGSACAVQGCMPCLGHRDQQNAGEGGGAWLNLLPFLTPSVDPAKNHRISDLQRAQDLHGDEWEAV